MNNIEQLIKKLLSGEGKLSLLLLEAKPLAEQANDLDLIQFIDRETNGYSIQGLPPYRKIQGQIIGNLKNAYNEIIYRGKSLDFSKFSDHLGFDISQVSIWEGIGFIEDTLQQITGQMVERPLPSEWVKILNTNFNYDFYHLTLTAASHEFGTASVQFILTKVRQDLIVKLQKINSSNNITIKEVNENMNESTKKIFVTYAWTDNKHKEKVISFTNFLRESGYDASMDRKNSQEESAINFNKMMVQGIQNSDKVIVVLNPKYKERANKFEGGVGTEIEIILEEIKSNPNKFIFVSFGENILEITPTAFKGRDILDLKKDQDEANFNGLFAKLESKNTIIFSDVSKTKPSIIETPIKPFKL